MKNRIGTSAVAALGVLWLSACDPKTPVQTSDVATQVDQKIATHNADSNAHPGLAIHASQLADKITGGNIAFNTIIAANIQDDTITGAKIASGGITSTNLAGGSVTSQALAANSVQTAAIDDLMVTTAKIANGAITFAQIDPAAGITGGQLANNTVTATQIANKTVTAAQIADNTVTATQIANNTITATQIASGTVTDTNLKTFESGRETDTAFQAFFTMKASAATANFYWVLSCGAEGGTAGTIKAQNDNADIPATTVTCPANQSGSPEFFRIPSTGTITPANTHMYTLVAKAGAANSAVAWRGVVMLAP